MSASVLAAAVVVILLIGVFVIYPAVVQQLGQPHCSATLTDPPSINVPSNYRLSSGTWVESSQTRLNIWDIRDAKNFLKFMLATEIQNDTVLENLDQIARAYSVRLVCEMAYEVKEIGNTANTISSISGFVGNVLSEVNIPQELKTQLTELKRTVDQTTSVAQPVADVITNLQGQADTMIQSRNDTQAEIFLDLLLTSSLAAATRYSLLLSLAIQAWEYLPTNDTSWFESFYQYMILGNLPMLTALSYTYGTIQAVSTVQSLALFATINASQSG